MFKRLRFKSLKKRLRTWLVIVALLPLLLSSILIYRQQVRSIKQAASVKIIAIRDMKIDQLNRWIDERIGDLYNISGDEEIRNLSASFKASHTDPNETAMFKAANKLLERFVKNHDSYKDIFIINVKTGRVALSSNIADVGSDKKTRDYFKIPLDTNKLFIADIHYSKTWDEPSMAFAYPITSMSNNTETFGILVARIDLTHSLYKLLLSRSGMGKTGETLIVNKNAVALNDLRWHENAPLNLKIAAKPAVLASQGNTGFIEDKDYRGVKVLAAYAYIPKMKWGVVAKQDFKEIYAPIRPMIYNILAIIFLSVIAVIVISTLLAQTIAQPVLAMAGILKKIQQGDLKARIRINSIDELGFLATSFNHMTDAVQAQFEMQNTVSEISNIMVNANNIKEFANTILHCFLEKTGSQMGAFYLLDPSGNRFEPVVMEGLDKGAALGFDATIKEGQFGRALSTRSISVLSDIPDDTRFIYKTFSGRLLPKEMITIPLLANEKALAIICMASLCTYPDITIQTINQIWILMNTAFSNILSNDKTRILADELIGKNQELESQSEELHTLNEELKSQTKELEEHNVELMAQRKQVEAANRLKSEFLSNMSHELRTPLNSIMALSRVLLMQANTKLSADETSYLEIIERNGKQLLALINDILDLSKIEAGKMTLTIKEFNLGLMLADIVERVKPVAREKGIELISRFNDDLCHISSDESKVFQIFQNIISNAVKFTDQGQIAIDATCDNRYTYVTIQDTGIGIEPNDLPFIFEEFRQVDGSSSRKYEGTGLGLAIARKSCKILGGKIDVSSEPGKGSVFTVTLPIKWNDFEAAEPALPLATKPTANRKTVLVVDDDPRIIETVEQHLIAGGYDTIKAQSGKQALELAKKHLPFAITLDIIMPDMDGWEILTQLKDDPCTRDIPVIIVSIAQDSQTGFALGAVGYATKPVARLTLLNELKRINQSGRKIMVVDDNPIDRQLLEDVLSKENFSVITATNGPHCLDLVTSIPPDVIILDLMMPDMDGFEVLEYLRQNDRTRDIPVIVLTAKDLTEQDRQRLRNHVAFVASKSDRMLPRLLEQIKYQIDSIDRRPQKSPQQPVNIIKHILLVEDNPTAVIQIKSILKGQGYMLEVAKNGQQALDAIRTTIPDGIILDLMMPGIDGFAVLEKIRQEKKTARIPVLVMTAKDLTAQDLARFTHNHIQQWVQKGNIDRQNLIEKIEALVGKKPGARSLHAPSPLLHTQAPLSDFDETADQNITNSLPKILIIEDHPDNMLTIKAVLTPGYNVIEATDGETGIKKALSHKPNLILLDMSLPVLDGYAVVKKIKDNAALRQVPVIAITAHAMKGDREKILQAGCDDYIAKPIDVEMLGRQIQKWLNRSDHA